MECSRSAAYGLSAALTVAVPMGSVYWVIIVDHTGNVRAGSLTGRLESLDRIIRQPLSACGVALLCTWLAGSVPYVYCWSKQKWISDNKYIRITISIVPGTYVPAQLVEAQKGECFTSYVSCRSNGSQKGQ